MRSRRLGRAALLSALLALAASLPAPAAAAAPRIDAAAAIVFEPATQTIVYGKAIHERRAIASTTKMMTAIVTVEHASLDDVVRALPYTEHGAESLAGFRAGERVTVADLLRALLVTSANDAAHTLAVRVAGSQRAFVTMMNVKARSLGLRDTHFATPVGLDRDGNYSSAADLVKIGLVLRQNPFLRRVVGSERVTLRSGSRHRTFENRNRLLAIAPEVDGIKTGYTGKAGYMLVGSAARGGVSMISAVLGEPSEAARDRDTLALLRYGLSRFHLVTAVRSGQQLVTVPLAFRGSRRAPLVAGVTVRRTVGRGSSLRVGVTGVPPLLDGPLKQGAQVGQVVIMQDGRIVQRAPLVTARAVDAATFFDRLRTWIVRPLTLALIAIFVVCSVYLLGVRRRARLRGRAFSSESEASGS